MSRTQRWILLLICLEILGGGWLIVNRWNRPLPPVPDLTGYNPYTSQRVRAHAGQVNPDVAADWAELGEVYLAHGFFPESEACLRRAVELAPEDPLLKYHWSICLSSLGVLEQAKQRLFDALAAHHPRPADCWYLIGRIQLCQERAAEARAAFQRATELPAARYELAKLDVRSGSAEAALALLTQVEAELPGAHAPHSLRAQAESLLGHDALAQNYLDLAELCSEQLPTPTHEFRKRLLTVFGNDSITQLVNDGQAMLGNGQLVQVDALVREAIGSHWDADVADLQATVESSRGNLAAHRQRLEAIIERDGADSYRLWRLGVALSATNERAAAEAYRAAVRMDTDPRAIDSLEQLAGVSQRLGDGPQAKWSAARFHYAVAMQRFRQANLVEARASLRKSVEIDAEYPHAWFYLGEIERLMRNPGAAQVAYDRCLQLNPDHGRALAARQRTH